MYHGITGPNTTFCQNAISAENALCYARNILRGNMADFVLVGGAEELSAMQYACYDAVRVLNRTRAGDGNTITPRMGSGMVLGEGAGFLVMERLDTAEKRGAKIYGVVRSAVVTGGPAPIGHYEVDGRQMARAVKAALADAGVDTPDIDQIDISANYSGELERMEYGRLEELFAGREDALYVTPLKYLMGDFGGAGIIRAAAILLSIGSRIPLPAIPLHHMKDGACELPDWQTERTIKTATALMTSSTFGGGSSSFVFTEV
jgi:3-oxoacyl-(acyl-carrier-protein) synthase